MTIENINNITAIDPNVVPVKSPDNSNFTFNPSALTELNKQGDDFAKTAPYYSPISSYLKGYTDDVSSFAPFTGGDPTPFIAGNPAAYEGRARDQSWTYLMGHAATQAVLGEGVGGTIQGLGTLLAPTKWIDRLKGVDDAWTPTFIEKIGTIIQNYAQTEFPIYKTQVAEQGAAFMDKTWLASMVPSTASAVSILLPARLAAILPVKLAELVMDTGKVGKSISSIQKAQHWANVVSSAFAGRVIDSTRESMGRYSQYYDQYKQQGLSDQEARETAADAASKGFAISHANLVFDLAEWGIMLRTGNYLTEETEDKLKNLLFKSEKFTKISGMDAEEVASEIGMHSKLKGLAFDALKTAGLEGTDEMSMDYFQQLGKYQAERKRDLIPEESASQILKDQLGVRSSWDSFIGGAFGGLLMMPMGYMMEKVTNKKYNAKLQDQANVITARAELLQKDFEEISKHLDNNDREKAQFTKDKAMLDLINRSAANNTLEWDNAMFDDMAKRTPEQLKAEGLNSQLSDYVSDMQETAKATKKIFDREMNVVRMRNADGSVAESNTYANIRVADAKAREALYNRRISENVIKDPGLEEFKGNNVAFNYLHTLIYNYNESDNLKSDLQIGNKQLLDLNEQIDKLQSELPDIKDTAERMVHQGILNSTKAKRDLVQKSIKETENNIANTSENQKVRLENYKILDPITKQKVDDRFKDMKPESYKSQVNQEGSPYSYKNQVKQIGSDIEFWNTKEGKESLQLEFDMANKLSEVTSKQKIQNEVEKVTTEKDLDVLRKQYIKDKVSSDIYEPLITAKRSTIKAKDTITAQTTKVTEDVKTATVKTNTDHTTEQNAAPLTVESREGLFGKDVAQTQKETETKDKENSESPITTDFTKLNNTSSKAANELLVKKQSNVDAGDFLVNPTYSRLAHAIKILDMILKDKGARETFRKSGIVQGKVNVNDIFDNLDKFNDPNNLTAGDAATILDAIFDAVGSITDANNENGYVYDLANGIEVITPLGNTTSIKETALLMADSYEHSINELVHNTISNYIDNLEVLSGNMFAGSLDSELISGDIATRKPSDTVLNLNVGNEKTFNEVTDNLRNGADIIKDMLRNKAILLGHTAKAITFDDIIKHLRDEDTTNDIVNDNWFSALQALKQVKAYLDYNIKIKETLKPKDQKAKEILATELKRLNDLNNKIDIKSLPYAEGKGQSYIDAFLKTHPREVVASKKPGTRAILNVYDERTGKRIEFDDDLRDIKGNNIWEALHLVKENGKVTFKTDEAFEYEGKLPNQDWQTKPIRVNVTDANGKETTILFVRELDYMDAGIRYGHLNDNGEYEFRGITSALQNRDYNTISENFDDIRNFYMNYHNFKGNASDAVKETLESNYLKAMQSIKSNAELNEVLLRIVNNNFTDTKDMVTNLSDRQLISIINPLFYKIRLEYAHEYAPSFKLVANKLYGRDQVYERDFEANKVMRSSINDGTLTESTISSVSTPSILINPHRFKDGEELPRLTMDRNVNQITLAGESSPRIVTIMQHPSNKSFIDMHTGNAITDPRFDYTGTLAKHDSKTTRDSGMYTLLEAPGNKLIAFPIKTNTIGLSYKNDTARDAAINFVTSKLIAAERALTASDVSGAASSVRHITIFDQTRDLKANETHWMDTHFIESSFTDQFGNKREPSTFIRIKTLQDIGREDGQKREVFYQIENEGRKGIITIYTSRSINDIYNRKQSALLKEDGKVVTFDINTPEGTTALTEYLNNDLVPYMQRQVHIDMARGKFSYSKEMIGSKEIEKPIDPVTGIEYNSPQDYYIQTGALYSEVGSVKDSNGKIITNFDITGRYPLSVNLNEGIKKRIPTTVEGVEGLVKAGVIDVNDPYLSFINTVAKSTGIKPTIKITGTAKQGVSASMQPIGKRWLLSVYEGLFDQKMMNNPYTPASLLIAHEYLHIGLSKSYIAKPGESKEDVTRRTDRIKLHNAGMTQWVNEVQQYWNSITDKVDFMKKTFPNIDMTDESAKRNVNLFEGYLNKSNADLIEKSGVGGTIQEPITYAFTTPVVAVVLNNMSGTDSLKVGNLTSWDKLRNLFFKIVSRIFGVELNDKGFLLKLNHILNVVYSDTVKLGNDEVRSVSEQKKTEGVTQVEVPEAPIITQEDQAQVEKSIEGLDQYAEDNDFELPDAMDAGSLEDNVELNIPSESKSTDTLTGHISNPQEQILDVLNNPIC